MAKSNLFLVLFFKMELNVSGGGIVSEKNEQI